MSNLTTNTQQLEALLATINALPEAGSGGTDTSDATATAGDILSGKTAYAKGEKITGTIATKSASNLTANGATVTVPAGYYSTQATKNVTTATQATPTISVNSSTGLITATATQTAGYVTAGSKSGTLQLAFQPAQTITPGTTNKTIAANTYLGGVQTIKGDANLVASNIVSGKSIFGVVGTATAGGSGSSGDTSMEDAMVTGTLTNYTNDRVKNIRRYAFCSCLNLTTANFPVCTSICESAFYFCTKLASVSFPACISIGSYAFYSCLNLTSVSFPACISIGNYAFYSCLNLTSASFPICARIGSYAFNGCSSLTTVSFPNCTTIRDSAFYFCTKLASVSFPACTSIGSYAFAYCSSLTSASFPVCTSIGKSAFYYCRNLASANFPVCTCIGSYAFAYCSGLTSVYLGASILCTLSASNAFSNTKITSTTGSIFVPASLVASYKAATNWTYFSNRIFSYNFT